MLAVIFYVTHNTWKIKISAVNLMRKRIKNNKSENEKFGKMQQEAVKDPFFTCLDRRHNSVMIAAPDLSMRYIKMGV
jgi:hypothetical protein